MSTKPLVLWASQGLPVLGLPLSHTSNERAAAAGQHPPITAGADDCEAIHASEP